MFQTTEIYLLTALRVKVPDQGARSGWVLVRILLLSCRQPVSLCSSPHMGRWGGVERERERDRDK